MYKIKLYKTSRCLWPLYADMLVVKWFFFPDIFINHFPKINESVLCKIAIDLLYFRDVYDVSLWGENLAEAQLINAEQMSLYNCIILRKKRDSNTGVFLWYMWNFSRTVVVAFENMQYIM